MSYLKARQLAREYYPQWTRRMRARWVLAKMQVRDSKVVISSQRPYSPNDYYFSRVYK